MYLRPSNIHYSQNSISNTFHADSPHGHKLIGETLDDLCEGRCSVTQIPIITVTDRKENAKWVTGDNRRLWIFKHLERLGKCKEILVRKGRFDFRKMNSKNGGTSVTVRGLTGPGGVWHLRDTPVVSYSGPNTTVTAIEDQIVSGVASQLERFKIDKSSPKQTDTLERTTYLFKHSSTSRSPQRDIFYLTRNEASQEHLSLRGELTSEQEVTEGVHANKEEIIPILKGSKERLLVAAIDFGTSNSGYAYSFKSDYLKDPLNSITNQWNKSNGTSISFKAPTCILFNRDQQFDSFGFDAEEKYAQLATEGYHKDWFYFKHFKMLLYDNKQLNRATQLADDKGKTMSAMTVFTECITYLKNHLTKAIDMQTGLRVDEIQWVLTVPAIWNESAKQFMKDSAIKAGISVECLSLALEPEAASIYCKHTLDTGEEYEDEAIDGPVFTFEPGTKYLLLDAGGGTVDITVHETQCDSTVRELYKANGGPWGGTKVDEAFLEYLAQIFGKDTIDTFKRHDVADYFELLNEFERKKKSLDTEHAIDQWVNFKMPLSIFDAYEYAMGKMLSPTDLARHHTRLSKDKLQVQHQYVLSMFTETCANIVGHLKGVFSYLSGRGVNAILMVGGFSESKVLQHAIRRAFPMKTVIAPVDAGMAVLKGAVIHGHNPQAIASRVSRFTYGIEACMTFVPGVHPISKKVVYDVEDCCSHCFDKHVEIGQELKVGMSCEERSYGPVSVYQTIVALSIYSSERKNPSYVDEAVCSYLGTVNVDLSDMGKHENKEVIVRMMYGDTELHVEAVTVHTNKKLTATFDFLR